MKYCYINLAEIPAGFPEELRPERSLRYFKGWDSIGQIAVLALVETDLGVSVPLKWISQCKRLSDILDFVHLALGE